MSARVTRSWTRIGRRREQRQLRARPAEQRLGLEDEPVAHRDAGLAAGLRGVDGQVAAGVPGPDDEHAVAVQVAGVAVAAGVQHVPVEAARIVGHERVPQVPVGDDHAVVGAALAVGGRDLPAREAVRVERPRRRDRRVEADVRAQAVVRGEAEDVVAHLVAAREQRIVRRHREALEARRVARRDQVQALVVGVPVPADAVAALEAVDGKTFVEEHLQRAQPGGAGADQAVVASAHAAEYREPAAREREPD